MRPIGDHEMLTLKDACEVFFGGRVSVATLKAEHGRGNLVMSKIGRAYFTTIAKLRDMEEKCLVDHPAQSSGSIKHAERGPSRMAGSAIAQDSALMRLQERKKRLGITSRSSTR